MKSLHIALLAFVFVACNSPKKISNATSESVHRYSVVYEGNKIIRYDKQEKQAQLEPVATVASTEVAEAEEPQEPQEQKVTQQSSAKRNSPLVQMVKTAAHTSKKQTKISEVAKEKAVAGDVDNGLYESDLGWGFAGFMTLIGAIILGIIFSYLGVAFPVIGLLWIFALVASIIGMVKRKSKMDYRFGLATVLIIGISLVLSIALILVFVSIA